MVLSTISIVKGFNSKTEDSTWLQKLSVRKVFEKSAV